MSSHLGDSFHNIKAIAIGRVTKFRNTKYICQSFVKNAISAITMLAMFVWKHALGIIRYLNNRL
jgi:hypothetical protein